jgi:hypothetical protein
MKLTKLVVLAAICAGICCVSAQAQSPFLYRMTLKGTCYQTNASGNFVASPVTDSILVQEAAKAGNVNPASIGLMYHLQSSGLGDTIDIVNVNTGLTIVSLFGLYFGDDASLGRSAATNSTHTEIRRLDYIYTQQNTTYTSFNSHSMGSAFTAKRFLKDTNGITMTTVEAQMSWIANPSGTNGTRLCTVNFNTTTPFR